MADYSLIPVDHQPDFDDVSLVPVEHDPFGIDGVTQPAQSQLAQTQPVQMQPQCLPQQPVTGAEPNAGAPADRPAAPPTDRGSRGAPGDS